MLDKKKRYSLLEISNEIKRIDNNCENVQYSLSDARDLEILAGQLRVQAMEIVQCCT